MASPAHSTQRDAETVRNAHNYTLKLDLPLYDPVNRMWRGEAAFTISACPQAHCFHLYGRSSVPPFSMIHLENIPRNGYDSPDWRVTLISRNKSGNGCVPLPSDLAGYYNDAVNR